MGMSLEITEEIIARQPPEARAIIRLLLAEIARLETRIEELERGRKTPQNSSLPPSTVHPHARPASPKRRSKKKRGGQPGHEKHERALIPSASVTRSSRSNRPNADVAARNSLARTPNRCGIRCGNFPKSSPT